MANLATVLKSEIARLARKETKTQLDPLRKANAGYRRDIAALKREVAALSKQLKTGLRAPRAERSAVAPRAEGESPRVRFQAKGLKSHREKLGISAAEYGRLAGVSAQSIYNWEAGKTAPRAAQVQALAALRGMGKRAATRQLEDGAGE
ncbi:helix-turn-helix domain-containing protein [Luteimonas sp. MC1750]|uniref:helix-turn-helix transcriptional regulator n=1 Tax=Luteimonas sp. MC1750 TaxID=2799326 RepID=UPI0018F0D3CB|nr:helix-turn-helix domain-containing protein [Luteimonas sp. MC1750]MBJ6983369.1 helix-turn-helix domain-containing protein [Luteimonas sp. MC1750]QQO06227.1 helix-turn-helix domain-containing protein [Luteimonas sp. MC1750]